MRNCNSGKNVPPPIDAADDVLTNDTNIRTDEGGKLKSDRDLAGWGASGGLIAGLAIVVLLGFKDCAGSCTSKKTGIIAALIGLSAGGLIGGRALAGKGKRTLIYSAP